VCSGVIAMNELSDFKASELVEISIKELLKNIPFGSFMVDLYDAVKDNCLKKRRKAWEKRVEERLSTLECSLTDLSNSEMFVTALIRSTEIAMKTSEKEKLEYLSNALLNSYIESIDETRLCLYFNLIEKYTIAHIKMMRHFYILSDPLHDNHDNEEINSIIMNDLSSDGLLNYSYDAVGKYSLSDFGKGLLKFISSGGSDGI